MTELTRAKSSLLTCPNISCGKVFERPLKTLNVQQGAESVYDACPYCLSELKDNEAESPVASAPAEVKIGDTSFCPLHLGYLYERKVKDNVPDGCLVCKNIVTCMLKDPKG